MNEWMTIVGQVGFPIFTALYLMIRMENTLMKLTEAINQLYLLHKNS